MVTRTELHIEKFECKIGYSKPVFLIGSCFSDNMGYCLERSRIPHISNPFGTLYNSSSILAQLEFITENSTINTDRIISRNDNYYHLDFHSSFWGKSKSHLIEKLEAKKKHSHDYLVRCSHIFITLGTAWVYALTEDGKTVANCHKMPSSLFIKKLLDTDTIFRDLKSVVKVVRNINPFCEIFFTLSPVRHIKDGLIENSRSKARLLEAIHLTCDTENTKYFPAYEWMIDDLRDYRYYDVDMIHPSSVAVNFIWEKFSEAFFTNETKELIKFAEKIFLMKQHKISETEGTQYEKHIEKIKALEREWKTKLDLVV